MKRNIIGIQQVGVGIPDVNNAWEFYRKNFGMDIPIFQESAEAKLMTPYTGGKVHARSAVLAINLQGGSGLEIWQYTSRKPEAAKFEIQFGDLGVFITRIKCKSVEDTFEDYKRKGLELVGDIKQDPAGKAYCIVKDPFGNLFQLVESVDWFRKGKHLTGGVCGAMIGVTDTDRSLKFYSGLLGYDKVIYDKTGEFDDLKELPSGAGKFRRILLKRTEETIGNFSKLLGESQIELIQALDRKPNKIFENRFWGDLGFIHLCFDVKKMKDLEKSFAQNGHPFTVDSSSVFDMGEAAGHFSYIEDPDGTLIEFVETYRIPILKKIGWYLNVAKRNPNKTLPKWMLSTLSLTRVKDKV